jgi:hypothetical protein
MFKDTCSLLIKENIGVPVYMVLKSFYTSSWKSSYVSCRMDSPNAEAYNHTNATIIRIRIA